MRQGHSLHRDNYIPLDEKALFYAVISMEFLEFRRFFWIVYRQTSLFVTALYSLLVCLLAHCGIGVWGAEETA